MPIKVQGGLYWEEFSKFQRDFSEPDLKMTWRHEVCVCDPKMLLFCSFLIIHSTILKRYSIIF